MGSFFKPKTKTTQNPYEQNPWEPQQDYLKEGFTAGLEQLQAALAGQSAVGDPVANLNDKQLSSIQNGFDLGNQTQNVGSQLSQQGMGLAGNANDAAGALSGLDSAAQQLGQQGQQYGNLITGAGQQASDIGGQMAQAGQQAQQTANAAGNDLLNQASQNQAAGVQGAQNVQNTASQIAGQAGNYAQNINQNIDQTGQYSQATAAGAGQLFGDGSVGNIINDAQQVANNPYLQSQIDSAIGDVQRGFQGTQAQINANASGAGGMNSTRAGLLESKALESATRQASDISSGMRSDAYNTGLSTALQNKNTNNSVLNTMLGAGQQQMGLNDQRLATAGMDLSTQLSANNQNIQGESLAQQARNSGFDQTSQGYNTQLGGYDQLMAGLNGNLSAQGLAGSLYGSAGSTALGAGQAALEAQQANNAQRLQIGQYGSGLAGAGLGLAAEGNSNAYNAGSILQTQAQNEINGQLAQSSGGLDLVQQYMAAIGGNYGSNGFTSTTTQKASPFQQLVGGVTSVMGAL